MPKFYDGNSIDILARDEGSLARIIARKLTNVNSRKLQALLIALLGQAVGGRAVATQPRIVQAENGQTGGLVAIATHTIIDRVTVLDDRQDIELLLSLGSVFSNSVLGSGFILGQSRLGGSL